MGDIVSSRGWQGVRCMGSLASLLRKPPLLAKQKAPKILPSVFLHLHDPRMHGGAPWWWRAKVAPGDAAFQLVVKLEVGRPRWGL